MCRAARKPYAVVLNGAPARRDEAESRIVTIAREALAKFRAPVWGGQITNRADLLMALGKGEGAREYFAEGRAAAEIGRLWAAIERSVKAIRGTASASGAMHKQAAWFVAPRRKARVRRVVLSWNVIPCEQLRSRGMTLHFAAKRRSIHHQHIEQDDRRQAQDDRPDADRPKNVLDAEAPIFRESTVLSVHDALHSCFCGGMDKRRILKMPAARSLAFRTQMLP